MVNSDTNAGKAAFAAAFIAVAIGVSVLSGWIFDLEYLRRIIPGHVTMNPATAVAFILAGISLTLFLRVSQDGNQKSRALPLTARLCALVVILIGLARFAALLSGSNLGVDQWLFASRSTNALGPPNHIAPNSAANFLLLGGALLLVDVRRRSVRHGVEFAAVVVGLISLLAVLGHAYGVQPLYRLGPFEAMSMHTAITFGILSVGLLVSHTDSGLLAIFAGDNAGSKLARRLLPATVLITTLIGWFARLGEEAGYPVAFCDAAESMANISILTILVCWSVQRLHHADVQRRETEERFSGAFEHAPIGVALLSPAGPWLKVNRVFCEMVGYSEADLLARTDRDITHPDDIQRCAWNIHQLVTRKIHVCSSEKRYVHASGRIVIVSFNLSLVRDGQGRPNYLIAQMQDITERERAECALQDSKRFLQATLDALSSHIAILDEDGVIVEVNAAWNRYARENGFEGDNHGVGDTYLQVCGSPSALHSEGASVAAGIRDIIKGTRNEFQLEYSCHGPQDQRWFLVRVTRFDGDGPVRVVVAHENITALKLGEEEIRTNEERYRSLVQATAAIVWVTDASGQFQMEQPGWTTFTGQGFNELRGWGWLKAVHPDDQAETARVWSAAVADRSIYEVEHRVRARDRTYRNMLMRAVPILAEDGTIFEWIGVHSDITERKRAETALRESEERYRALIDWSPEPIAVQRNEILLFVNPAAVRMMNATSALDLVGKSARDLIHPDSRQDTLERRKAFAASGGDVIPLIEQKLIRLDGTVIDVETQGAMIVYDGEPAVYLSMREVTERNRAEEWRSRLVAIIESSEDAIVSKDLNGNVTSWNAAAEKMFGYSTQEMVGFSIRRLIPPTHQEEEERIMSSIKRGEPVLHLETVRLTKSGTMIDVSVTVSPIKDAAGRVVGASRIARNITEQKRAEAELRWKTAFLEAQVNSSLDGVLVVDGQGQKLLQNQRFIDLLKIPQHIADDGDKEKQTLWISGKTKDPAAYIVKVAHLYSHPDETGRDEIEFIDGTFLDRYSAPVVGNDGVYFGRITTFRDITERRRAEALLLQSQQRLALATESAHIGIWDWDAVENKLVWDARMLALYGLCPQEGSDMADAWRKGLHPEDREQVEAEFAAAVTGAPEFRSEFRVVWPGGEVREIQAYGLVQRATDGSAKRVVGVNWDVTARKRTEARYRRLVESNVQGIHFWTAAGRITGANDAFLSMIGYSREDLEAGCVDWLALTPPEHAHQDRHALADIAAQGVSALYEKEYVHKDGSRVPVLFGSAAFEDNPEEGVSFVLDLTDRKRLETQLIESQKMETVGKLAGGIAHEFNSILTAIIGQSELLLADLPSGSPLVTNATEITKAAGRAAALTRQLLAYGRKQLLQPEALDLNRVITRMEGVLRHLMGGEIGTRIVATPGLHAVKADAGQLEQVIMQMALNARDAMPNGGKFTLETANVTFDQESVGDYPELKPGDYVMLAITDSGQGMSPEVKARLFEPFFSTKAVGQGTGLGLSTCYGIIKQSGGHISVYSELALGSTFKVYLPQVEPPKTVPVRRPAPTDLPRGTETILLVEDDPAMREMASALLRRLGYTVLAAANGIEALSLKQQRGTGPVDLLFTDVVMPHMTGKELADRVQALYPHTRVLFTSAYTENAIDHHDVLDKGVALLQKPFMPSALAHKVRAVLDQPNGESTRLQSSAE